MAKVAAECWTGTATYYFSPKRFMVGLAKVLKVLGILASLSKDWWPGTLGEHEDWVSAASLLDL